MKSADAVRKTVNDFSSQAFYEVLIKFAATADSCVFCLFRSAQTITFKASRPEIKSLANTIFCRKTKTDVGKFLRFVPLVK